MQASAPSLNTLGADTPPKNAPNYGERLYRRGLKKREERENVLRNARSEQMRAEIDEFTF